MMRTSRILLVAIVIAMLAGSGGGGGDPTTPVDLRTVSVHLFPRTVYTIVGKQVELTAQALMDDDSTIGINGVCEFILDDQRQ